jgi:hypothetical protein
MTTENVCAGANIEKTLSLRLPIEAAGFIRRHPCAISKPAI